MVAQLMRARFCSQSECLDQSPRIVSDNGPQVIAGDFRRFIDLTGLSKLEEAREVRRKRRELDHASVAA